MSLMRHVCAMVALLAGAPLAGCISDDGDVGPTTTATDGTTGPAAPAALLTEWSGHIVVGAAFEAPAHFEQTEPIVAPLWRSGFVFQVDEAPQDLQARLDWTGVDATQIQLMVHAPDGGNAGWYEYTTPFSSEKSQCLRVPVAELGPGHWQFMVHTLAGAQVEYTITVITVGGVAAIHEGPHGHAYTDLDPTTITERESEPCDDQPAP